MRHPNNPLRRLLELVREFFASLEGPPLTHADSVCLMLMT